MKILMISIDRGLLGKNALGDVLTRHAKYGQFVDWLDIIVFNQEKLNPNNIADNVVAYPTNSSSKLKYVKDAVKVGKSLFKKNHYDLIVCQDPFLTGWAGLKLKKAFGAKLLIHFHGDFWQNKEWLKENPLNYFMLWLSGNIVPKADGIRVMSQGQKEKLVTAGINGGKIRIISTPVDIKKYERSVQQYPNKNVLHVSRFDKVKDFNTLAQAFALVAKQLPDTKFIQVGAGDRAKEFFKDINIQLIPQTAANELIDIYHQATVVVLSSTSESFGKVLVEANACGKPVVSTATTGAKEIIQDGVNGYLVPIGNAKALAEKIIYLLENLDKAQEMGRNGQQLVKEKYGDNTKRIIDFWQVIINN